MKKIYEKPEMSVHMMNLSQSLLAGSQTEDTGSAEGMISGSFGSREWDDDDFDE
ncbi:MAG: hypothetical protein IJ527_08405 [Prevotella sp.]|nr:hypothetical protein [Prevotella sp.]